MVKAWNPDRKIFGQSYEDTDVLDSSVMIMPLVFFMNAVCLLLFCVRSLLMICVVERSEVFEYSERGFEES